jgi:hypothetical protein
MSLIRRAKKVPSSLAPHSWNTALVLAKRCVCVLVFTGISFSQTMINLATQARNADLSSFAFTRPTTVGSALPGTCQKGQLFFNIASPPGTNLFGCTAANVWTMMGTASSGVITGQLASLPPSCATGVLYFATDQPAGQQLYTCSATNAWTQLNAVGGSGALAFTNGALDIVTSVVPRLTAANTFTGFNVFSAFQVRGTPADPGCTSTSDIGKIWINTTSSSNTMYEVCLLSSGTPQWVVK